MLVGRTPGALIQHLIQDGIILVVGTDLCTAKRLVESLASTHSLLTSPIAQVTTRIASRHCQMSPWG